MSHRLTATAAMASILASTALFPLIMGGKWFWGGVGAAIVMAAVGTVTRLRPLRGLPAAACLCIALIFLLLYLNLVYASGFSVGRALPTGASVTHLWNLARQGMADTQRYAPPVPALSGTVLLATAGIGAIAALTDLVAVRLRRCALAGLPLLALFSVPVAAGVEKNAVGTTVVFCLGMAGYLALLGADGRERLRLWGRLVTIWQPAPDEPGDDQSGPNTRALAASGRRVGLAAVVLAIFAPLLIPGLHAHKIFPGHSVGTGPGLGAGAAGSFPDPLVQMNRDLQESKPQVVLTYHTSVPAAQYPPYLQTYVLNKLTTDNWTMSLTGNGIPLTQSGGLPPVRGLVQAHWRKIRTSVAIRQGTRGSLSFASFLPAPYPPHVLIAPGNWKADPGTLMLYSTSQSLSGLNYTVNSYDVTPSEQLLASAGAPQGLGSYLQVPAALQPLLGYARKITKGAASRFAEAVDLQNWFQSKGGFSYSLKAAAAAPNGAADLRQFLLSSKHGYCQQFAFAMAVLARLLGIPSRIAVGFTAGTSLGNGNWQVKTSDAHSWPELYFTGFGWLSWEPTPRGNGVGQGTAVAPAYTQPGSGGGTTTGPRGVTGPVSRQNQPGQTGGTIGVGKKRLLQQGGQSGLGAATAPHGGGLPVPLLVIAALLAVALVGPRVTRSFTRRRRWLAARDDTGRANAAWLEFLDDLADHGIRHGPGETPRAVARRVAASQRLDQTARQALQRLVQAQERACYAREPESGATLSADVAAVRRAVSGSVSRSARWQARLLPASAVSRAREGLSHGLDAFGWADVAMTRIRGRLPRARTAGDG